MKDMDAVLAVVGLRGSKVAPQASALQALTGEIGGPEDIKIESYSSFHPDCYGDRGVSILRSLRIQPHISNLADGLWNDSGCDSKMIGIHYRGTDHRKCIEASPLHLFVERMSEWLDEVPGARFLVCTDEHGVAKTLKDLFGDRVVIPVEVRGRRVLEQQILGVVDWLLLHRCPMVWASAGSSFSELATIRSGGTLLKVTAGANESALEDSFKHRELK